MHFTEYDVRWSGMRWNVEIPTNNIGSNECAVILKHVIRYLRDKLQEVVPAKGTAVNAGQILTELYECGDMDHETMTNCMNLLPQMPARMYTWRKVGFELYAREKSNF